MRSRNEVVKLINSWEGTKELNGGHRFIIDIYNSHKLVPRNVKMQYNWPWCACTWSALAIKLGYTDIMPIEISCGLLIEEAKRMGCWQENDGYVPKPGDGVLYDWGDSGKGDNTGWPDHIGTVIYVNESSGYFTVMEGNYSDSVKKRTVSINGKYIRGFITPKYDNDVVEAITFDPGKDLKTLAMEVISGIWGNGEERKKLLREAGYSYEKVQDEVCTILNIPSKTSNGVTLTNSVVSSCYAKEKDQKLTGNYVTTANVYCRNDAGTNKKALVLIPKGIKVANYGFYTTFSGAKWLLIKTTVNGVSYTGFTHEKYLQKA